MPRLRKNEDISVKLLSGKSSADTLTVSDDMITLDSIVGADRQHFFCDARNNGVIVRESRFVLQKSAQR